MYSNHSFLNRWIIQNKYRKKTNDTSVKRSHLLLNGGNYYVPNKKQDDFLKIYTKDIMLGIPHYLSEVRTPIFRYFIDIDYYDYHELSLQQIRELTKDIQNALKPFLEDQLDIFKRRVFVCVCDDPKKEEVDGKLISKTGIHLHWPDIFVDSNQAFILRSAILQYLENKNGPTNFKTWDDFIDESVYKGSGLRLLGSRKAQPCKQCKGKKGKKEECIECNGIGKLDLGRIYKLKFILDGFNNEEILLLKELKQNFYSILKRTTIKSLEEKSNISLDFYPNWFDPLRYKNKSKKRKNTNKKSKNKKINFEEHSELQFRKKISEDDERFSLVIDFLNKWLPKEYEKPIDTIDLYLCGEKTNFYVINTRFHYCMNKQDEHSSNHIYFYISQDNIIQKCFSEKVGYDGKTKCCDFSFNLVKLPIRIKKKFFPENFEDQKLNKYKLNTNKKIKGFQKKSKIKQYKKYCSYFDIASKRLEEKKRKLNL